ncbi:hypothetical protein NSQ20_25550 [Paenibacillus sp. FSL K6-1122]|uniref:hypothetical protein n=1 Tax=Paenibacillus sp. FSL K6-1122 TaxID=2954512 RepID=UPI0030EE7E54
MLLTIIGAVLGTLLGAVVTYIFYLIQRNRSRICYQTSNLKIIGNLDLNLPQDFEVTLSGERIESLYKSQIIVWNDGTNTIHKTDITEEDQLRVVFDTRTKIFDVSLVGCTREINKNEAFVLEGTEVTITFDFWDKKDGIVLDILHTESKTEPKIKGTVKGLINGIKNKGQIDYIKKKEKSGVLLLIHVISSLMISTVIALFFMYFYYLIRETDKYMSYFQVFTSVFIGSYIASFVGFANIFSLRKRFPRTIKFKHSE